MAEHYSCCTYVINQAKFNANKLGFTVNALWLREQWLQRRKLYFCEYQSLILGSVLWRLCNIPVTWSGSWILPVPSIDWLWLCKLLFPISSTLLIWNLKNKDCPCISGKWLSQIFLTNQMGAKLQGLELGCTSHLILGPVHPHSRPQSRIGWEEK